MFAKAKLTWYNIPMKILIISDTHNIISNALSVIRRLNPTHIVHLGDMVTDADAIKISFPNIEMLNVRGNNDFFTKAPENMLIELDSRKFFLTHGHKFGVKWGVQSLAQYAKNLDADYALFGHTHNCYNDIIDGVRLLNPSSNGYIVIETNKVEVCKY